jgi:hypothetical protein
MTQTSFRRIVRSALVLALLTFLSVAAPAAAQTFAPSVTAGQTVFVTNAQGAEIRGKVTSITDTGLDLATGVGARHFALADIWMIQKKDSNREGWLIGSGVGLLSATINVGEIAPSQRPFFIVFAAAFYGGMGALIDNGINGRQLLYNRPSEPSRPIVTLSPLVSLGKSKSLGFGGAIVWK